MVGARGQRRYSLSKPRRKELSLTWHNSLKIPGDECIQETINDKHDQGSIDWELSHCDGVIVQPAMSHFKQLSLYRMIKYQITNKFS
jgi:hypothetical protein